ncbi:MAG TPA: EAL domain-containing protein [Pyrinomonadaceae bacterium]|nr:EAL domain-containing protein [Pyrinomonadaceae bacterium]
MRKRSAQKPVILIIDDDDQIRSLLSELLKAEYECVDVSSAEEALEVLKTINFDLVISDIQMGGISGLDLVPRILKDTPDTVVVMISGQQTVDSAIEAMRVGAFDYITKPLDLRHVQAAVRRAQAQHQLLSEKRQYENHLEELVAERTAEIEHLAFYDRLTDLPNRLLFADRCAQALASAQRSHRPVGVLLVSLDRFKTVADTLGHAAGDIVLSEAAARLQTCVSEADTVARFDGEEFALLLTQIAEAGDLADVSLAVSEALKEPFRLGDQVVYVTTSIGISVSPFNGEDSNTVLRNAGAALYRAKQQGGNDYQFYAADMNAQAVERLALENSLRSAVENNEFITYYQPVVNLVSSEVVGLEALVRWQHPELGLLPPARFIGLAEDTGQIMDIGECVMRTACAQTRLWQDDGLGRLRIAVNISARHFQQKNFLDRLRQVLGDTRLDPTCLELELTETSIMENGESAVRLLNEIRNLGVKIAIDDFGTGYSSLGYLKRLPIDTLKLDQSFVNGATTDPDDAALVMAIVTLAHNLRLKVVAEGIETAEQLAFLRLLRCDEGQGYLFSKPVTHDVFASSLRVAKRKLHVIAGAKPSVVSSFPSAVNE